MPGAQGQQLRQCQALRVFLATGGDEAGAHHFAGPLRGNFFVAAADHGGKQTDEGEAVFFFKRSGFAHVHEGPQVDDGAERFEEVVGKVEGVQLAMVVDAEYGDEAGGDERAGERGPDDGVSVVETAVQGIG